MAQYFSSEYFLVQSHHPFTTHHLSYQQQQNCLVTQASSFFIAFPSKLVTLLKILSYSPIRQEKAGFNRLVMLLLQGEVSIKVLHRAIMAMTSTSNKKRRSVKRRQVLQTRLMTLTSIALSQLNKKALAYSYSAQYWSIPSCRKYAFSYGTITLLWLLRQRCTLDILLQIQSLLKNKPNPPNKIAAFMQQMATVRNTPHANV